MQNYLAIKKKWHFQKILRLSQRTDLITDVLEIIKTQRIWKETGRGMNMIKIYYIKFVKNITKIFMIIATAVFQKVYQLTPSGNNA